MRTIGTLALLALCLGLATPRAISAPADDAAKFDGAWKVTSLKLEGQDAPADDVRNAQWTFKAGEVKYQHATRAGTATFKVDAAKTPAEIDVKMTEGENVGDEYRGIYRLEKDKLTLAIRIVKTEKGRPTDLQSEPDSGIALVALERQP